jgi:hypothetical protein
LGGALDSSTSTDSDATTNSVVELVRSVREGDKGLLPESLKNADKDVMVAPLSSSSSPLDQTTFEEIRHILQLKEADNRFLQEELDSKDKTMAMLTEGLKEVELGQTQWFTINHQLTMQLDRSEKHNKELVAEVARLKNLVLSFDSVLCSRGASLVETFEDITAGAEFPVNAGNAVSVRSNVHSNVNTNVNINADVDATTNDNDSGNDDGNDNGNDSRIDNGSDNDQAMVIPTPIVCAVLSPAPLRSRQAIENAPPSPSPSPLMLVTYPPSTSPTSTSPIAAGKLSLSKPAVSPTRAIDKRSGSNPMLKPTVQSLNTQSVMHLYKSNSNSPVANSSSNSGAGVQSLLRGTSSMDLIVDGVDVRNLRNEASIDAVDYCDIDFVGGGGSSTSSSSDNIIGGSSDNIIVVGVGGIGGESCDDLDLNISRSVDYKDIYAMSTLSDDIISGRGIGVRELIGSSSSALSTKDHDSLPYPTSSSVGTGGGSGGGGGDGGALCAEFYHEHAQDDPPIAPSIPREMRLSTSAQQTTMLCPEPKRGCMLKLGAFRTWKIRYFVLEGGYLSHYDSMTAASGSPSQGNSKENNTNTAGGSVLVSNARGDMCLRNFKLTEVAGSGKAATSFILRLMDSAEKDTKGGVLATKDRVITSPMLIKSGKAEKTTMQLDVRVPTERQGWIVAINEHIAYQDTLSNGMIRAGSGSVDESMTRDYV